MLSVPTSSFWPITSLTKRLVVPQAGGSVMEVFLYAVMKTGCGAAKVKRWGVRITRIVLSTMGCVQSA